MNDYPPGEILSHAIIALSHFIRLMVGWSGGWQALRLAREKDEASQRQRERMLARPAGVKAKQRKRDNCFSPQSVTVR